mmetsp:Transcript_30680/g.66106  ORF Transcript_30680/g.66106 Transcript_30680/m.66106 type:complete len:281 (-) Transcript_30680:107-949(-)
MSAVSYTSNVADLSTLNQMVGEPVASVAVVAVVAGHVGRSRPAARATNLAVAAAPDLLGMRPHGVPCRGVAGAVVGVAGMVHHSVPLGVVLCHDMRWRGDRHMDVVIWTTDVDSIGLFDVDHLWWLWHRNWHSLRHGDMLHHGGPRHVHMHILWRAWHVVGVVDGLHNRRMGRHWLWHGHADWLSFHHCVIDVLVDDGFGAVITAELVAAPSLVLLRPECLWSPGHATIVVLRRFLDVHSVDDGWLLRHLHFHIVIHRNLPVDRSVVTAHNGVNVLFWVR